MWTVFVDWFFASSWLDFLFFLLWGLVDFRGCGLFVLLGFSFLVEILFFNQLAAHYTIQIISQHQ
jgi:hypothetical protein